MSGHPKNKWPCPGKPEALAGMPIGMYHCEFCDEMQLAGSPHLPPQFPSQWEAPFPTVPEPEGPPTIRVVMKDGRTFEAELFDRSWDAYKREGWFSLAVDHGEHSEIPDVFLFEECERVVDLRQPDIDLLPIWAGKTNP